MKHIESAHQAQVVDRYLYCWLGCIAKQLCKCANLPRSQSYFLSYRIKIGEIWLSIVVNCQQSYVVLMQG